MIVCKCPDGWSATIKGKYYECPEIGEIAGVEYVEPKICLDCGQCQGKFPVDLKK